MKDIFKDKIFQQAFLMSLISFIIILFIFSIAVWHYRGAIFGYFSKQYLSEVKTQNDDGKVIGGNEFTQESLVIDAVKKTNPAVISIIISKNVPKYETYYAPSQNPFGNLFPGFGSFFNVPQYRQNGTEKKEIGGGSGFFVSPDGLIVTNKHVVDQKDVEYTVFTNDGKKHPAKVIARDPVLDIALIKIDAPTISLDSPYPYLELGDSEKLQVGQSVIAIGNALAEFRNTVSVGVVSGLARSITAGVLDHVIQTDAAINPGNSGGPLLDLYGRVIGVNVAVAQNSENIGFALPINSVKGAIESVKATGKIVRPYLGIRYVPVTPEMKDKNDLSVDYGILVQRGTGANDLAVIPGSPADKAGIVENDIILEIDGTKIDEKTSFAYIIRGKKVGDIITLKILHKGDEKTLQVTLEAAKDK
jgi:serine protease Do